jgi:5,10-methylenetetrahydrofolate reductase
VAYNPHFDEGSDAAAREFERLEKKMRGGLVCGVWFQIGSDVEKLERGLERVRDLAPDAEIYGSVFLPSKQLLARMKFRPWAGVFLSDEYLSSVERAEEITIAQMACLVRHGATPFIESPVTKDEDWAQCERLLAAAAKRVDESGKL